ncbi:hypothetical protein V1477_003245, partial [Vespula maculifrons]
RVLGELRCVLVEIRSKTELEWPPRNFLSSLVEVQNTTELVTVRVGRRPVFVVVSRIRVSPFRNLNLKQNKSYRKLEKMCENKYIYINSSLLLVENVYWENCDAYSSKFEARLN